MANNNQSLLEKVRVMVEPEYARVKNWAHGWQHVQSVESNCINLAAMEGESVILSGISGYCHDLGRVIEEEHLGRKNELGLGNHAYLSVKPTKKILSNLEIKGEDAYKIIEAVRIHSDFKYNGDNNIAHILRDADKGDGFGPWGLLRSVGFVLGLDFLAPEWDDKPEIDKKVKEVFDYLLKNGDKEFNHEGVSVLDKYKIGLKWNLEWYGMLETDSAKTLFLKDYEFIQGCAEKVGLS